MEDEDGAAGVAAGSRIQTAMAASLTGTGELVGATPRRAGPGVSVVLAGHFLVEVAIGGVDDLMGKEGGAAAGEEEEGEQEEEAGVHGGAPE